MFSSCPFHSLLENGQDLWFWVKIEKVMKVNVRMRQNKISQNIRKKDACLTPYDSLLPVIGALKTLLGSKWSLCDTKYSCMDHLKGSNGPLWPNMAPPGLHTAPQGSDMNHVGMNSCLFFSNILSNFILSRPQLFFHNFSILAQNQISWPF